MKWKYFPCYWPFVRGIHRSPVNSQHKDQWRGALMFSLICVWINDWVNSREAGDLRRYRAHYDATLKFFLWIFIKLSDFMWTGKYYAFFILSLCFLDIGVYKCLNVFNLTNINGLFTVYSDGYHLRELSRLIQKYQHFYVRFQIIQVFGAKSLNVLPIDIIWKNLKVYINLRKTHKGMVFQRCCWSLGKVICLINSFACALIVYLINVATYSRQFVLSL